MKSKKDEAEVVPAPETVDIRTTEPELQRRIRVVDAGTGETIPNIIAADALTGAVERYALDGDGNLVREDDHFVVITETRAIRIELLPAEDLA